MPKVFSPIPAIEAWKFVLELAARNRMSEEADVSASAEDRGYSVSTSNSDTTFITLWIPDALANNCKPVSSIYYRPSEQAQLQRHADVLCDWDSDEDQIETALRELQVALKQGSEFAANLLFSNAVNTNLPPSCRKLCLEALAGSRAADLRGVIRILIHTYLSSGIDELAFAAIAAATELPPSARGDLKPAVQPWVDEGGYLGRAASVFMAY